MNDSELEYYSTLLNNERGFHLLFCDLRRIDSFSLYHNRVFSEDPIFNHFVLNKDFLLNSLTSTAQARHLFQNTMAVARELKISTTIFLENFWPKVAEIEEAAIESGYRITDKMEILAKQAGTNQTFSDVDSDFQVSVTRDAESWNSVFMRCYAIPKSWRDELIRREGEALLNKRVNLVKSIRKSDSEPVGCLLTYLEPKGCLGIYCVGTVPEARRQGVAIGLLQFSEQIASLDGASLLTLQTLTSDHVAPMYKKIGYKTEFERDILWRT